jgi:hypothetical protein
VDCRDKTYKEIKGRNMLVKLIEIHKEEGERVRLDEVFVSKNAVTSIRSEKGSIINEAIQLGISEHAGFSRVTLNEGGLSRTIIVVGTPSDVKNKLGIKTILKG